MVRVGLILVLLALNVPFALSQGEVSPVDADTVLDEGDLVVPDITPRDSDLRSPAVALALSAVLPGAGQIYNGSYWKVPIILGFAGYFTYAIVLLNDYYLDYRQRFRDSITDENPMGNRQLRLIRDWYRDQRDRFGWYMGFLYIINLLDAYVEATLTGFDVGEDLTLRFFPYAGFNGSRGLQFQIEF